MTADVDSLAAQVRAGDTRALSRAITAIENRDSHAEELLRRLFPATGNAFLVGITGAPGTGKSTLVDQLAAKYRAQNTTVGIIAVDPTSPFTGGAILGDRIRMQKSCRRWRRFHPVHGHARFSWGAGRTTSDVALVLDAAGKQIVLIETVGVGRTNRHRAPRRLHACAARARAGRRRAKHESRLDGSRRHLRDQ